MQRSVIIGHWFLGRADFKKIEQIINNEKIMKKGINKLMAFVATFMLMCAFIQKDDKETQILQDLIRAEEEIIHLFEESDDIASTRFQELIINNPETMEYPFEKLKAITKKISFIESSDHNVRIYGIVTN